jgi:predicted nucleic acid-binding protein
VATRLPPEFRLTPADAALLLHEEVFSRMAVHDLPAADRSAILQTAARDGISGGRIYDAHIAEIARAANAAVIVTDNRRHFLSALRYDMRVETPPEFLAALKNRRT